MEKVTVPLLIEGDISNPPKKRKRKPKLIADDKFLLDVQRLSSLGLSIEQIHFYFGLDHHEWGSLVHKYPRISVAINKGFSHGMERAASQLWEKMDQGSLSAIMFYLKTRGGWCDKSNITVTQVAPLLALPKIILPIHDPIQAAKIYQQIMIEN